MFDCCPVICSSVYKFGTMCSCDRHLISTRLAFYLMSRLPFSALAGCSQDVVWVNQSWWLDSELSSHRDIWTQPYPDLARADAMLPDPKWLLGRHELGDDPYRVPGGKLTNRERLRQQEQDMVTETTVPVLNAAALATITQQQSPAFVLYIPERCLGCADMLKFWELVEQHYPG